MENRGEEKNIDIKRHFRACGFRTNSEKGFNSFQAARVSSPLLPLFPLAPGTSNETVNISEALASSFLQAKALI